MNSEPVSTAIATSDLSTQTRWIVIAPTYNHAAALGNVLQALALHKLPVIAINDGATDGTDTVLDRWLNDADCGSFRKVLKHSVNKGKAGALRLGFEEAARLGYTHAATIDTDGQHDVADLLGLLQCSSQSTGSIIIGSRSREDSDAPLASRIGRVLSNGMVWLESGVSVTDSQSGMRIYPLKHISAISGVASRYGFETEVLVRAGWYGVPVTEKTIRCIYHIPGGRTTHFRLWGDTVAAIRMHMRLLVRAHFPANVSERLDGDHFTSTIPRRVGRWFSPLRLREMAKGGEVSRDRLSASVGVGLLMATLPVYGIKTVACLWLAARFRLHPLAVVSVSSLSTPPLGLMFVIPSICVGGLLIHGQLPDLAAFDLKQAMQWRSVNTLVAEWLIGSVFGGAGLGIIGYMITRALLRRRSQPLDVQRDPERV